MAGWPENLVEEGWRAKPRPQGQGAIAGALGAGTKKMKEPEREQGQRRAPRSCTGLGKGQFPLSWEERAGNQCYLLQNAENRVLH